jgi:hypothetical protein
MNDSGDSQIKRREHISENKSLVAVYPILGRYPEIVRASKEELVISIIVW